MCCHVSIDCWTYFVFSLLNIEKGKMAEEFCTVLYLSTKTKPKNLNFLHNDLFYISFQINMTCLCKIAVMASANRIMDDSCNLGSHSRTSPSRIFWYHVGTKELTNTNTHKDEFVAMLLKCIYSDKKHKKPWKINTNSLSLPTWSSQTSTSSNMNESWQTQKFSISVRLPPRTEKEDKLKTADRNQMLGRGWPYPC